MTDVSARVAFASFGSAIHARNPHHLPRPISRELPLFDPKTNPWLNELELAAWLARDGEGGPVVGRIAAMRQPNGDSFIGLYEAEDDFQVAKSLFGAACEWLAAQGADKVTAPIDFSIFHSYRCQTRGFEEPPFVGEPRNPPYYAAHFAAAGFASALRWETHDMDRVQCAAVVQATADAYADACEIGYRFEDYRACPTEEAMRRSWQLVNSSYGSMPGFEPMSWERFSEHYSYLPLLVDRQASCFVYDPGGARVGFCIVMKDMSPALRAMRGHGGGIGAWLDRIRFLRHSRSGPIATAYQVGIPFREIKKAAVMGRRRLGRPLSLSSAIYHRGAKRILERQRYRHVVTALVRVGSPNIELTRPWSRVGREYALFERKLS